MDAVKQFQRVLYLCDEITANDMQTYPPLGEIAFNAMYQEYYETMKRVKVFVFFRQDLSGEKYFDLYIWDILGERECQRFIIQKDKLMDVEKESIFDFYCMNVEMEFGYDCKNKILAVCKEDYPDIHMQNYNAPGNMLAHLYYALHRCGPKELFFKAKLDYLAMHIEEVNDYNMLGSSPSAVLDGVSVALLQTLNSKLGIQILRAKERRKLVINIYKKFYWYIISDMGLFQWLYLMEAYKAGSYVHLKKIEVMGNVRTRRQYLSYKKYEKLFFEVKPWCQMVQYPAISNIETYIERAETIKKYIEQKEILDRHMQEIYNKKAKRYEYQKGVYFVKMPKSIFEVLQEAKSQHNCLWGYIEPIVEQKSIILFMRERDTPDVSRVTIEIRNDSYIHQAYAKFNEIPSEEQLIWLDKYAKKMGLGVQLFMDGLDEQDWEDE